jgi:hypothetical protein
VLTCEMNALDTKKWKQSSPSSSISADRLTATKRISSLGQNSPQEHAFDEANVPKGNKPGYSLIVTHMSLGSYWG